MATTAKFIPPQIQENPSGWGPCSVPDQFKDMPYQPFSKSDRIGRVADWTNQTYQDKRQASKYNTQYGGGWQYAYNQDDEEGSFQFVDTGKGPIRGQRGGRYRMGQRNTRNRQGQTRNQMQVLNKGGRGGRQQQQPQVRGGKWQRPQGRQKYDSKGQGMKRRDTTASVNVKPSWKVVEEMDFPRLNKLSLPNVPEGVDVYRCGSLEYYDKQYDRVNCRTEKPLQRFPSREIFRVTTTDDPIIRQLSKTEGSVFGTDTILSALMCATRSVTSWDVVVQRVGDKLFFDKRDDSFIDFPTVHETAIDPPCAEEDGKSSINSPHSLSMEAMYINHNFSQQVLLRDGQRYSFEKTNPFMEVDNPDLEEPSVAYKYRKFDLGDGIVLIVRTQVDAVTTGPSGKNEFLTIKGLNEWDPKASGGINWRQKLDTQRGAVLANELKNNSCKLARWTVQSLLSASDQIKFGYVSRVHVKDTAKHAILGTQQFKPREFSDQINLNMDNAWGILRCIIDVCMKLPQGKYLILKDPNKTTLLLYEIPQNTFEGDDDDEDEEDIEEGPEETGDADDGTEAAEA